MNALIKFNEGKTLALRPQQDRWRWMKDRRADWIFWEVFPRSLDTGGADDVGRAGGADEEKCSTADVVMGWRWVVGQTEQLGDVAERVYYR